MRDAPGARADAMNYYRRHIGDYLRDTSHLTLLEHGVYTRLLDVYYTREAAIPAGQAARLIGARSKEDREAVDRVLGEFFDRVGDAWAQSRCDREIEAASGKADRNREVGKLGGRPRRPDNPTVPKRKPRNNPDGFEKEPTQQKPTSNPSQEPIANSQKREERESTGARAAARPPDGGRSRSRSTFALDALPDAWAAYCREKRPDLEPAGVFSHFRDWHLAQGSLMADWTAAWRTWVGRERSATANAAPTQPATASDRNAAFAREWTGGLMGADAAQPDDPETTDETTNAERQLRLARRG